MSNSFKTNENLKKQIQKNMKFNRKSVKITYIIEIIMFIFSTVGPLLYFTINALNPNAYMGYIRGEFKKDYEVLIFLTSLWLGMGLTAWIFIKTLRHKLESVHMSERIQKTIKIIDSKLFYIFRMKYQSNPYERNVVVIDMNSLDKIDYDENSRKLTISGQMVEEYINTNKDCENISFSNAESRNLILYDYFEPSLKEYIKNNYNLEKQ